MKAMLWGASLFGLCACSYQSANVNNILSEVPRDSYTNMTWAVQCVAGELNRVYAENPESVARSLLAIDDFSDGTIPEQSPLSPSINGPLVDKGKFDFSAILSRFVDNRIVVVPYVIPSFVTETDQISGATSDELVKPGLAAFKVDSVYRIRGAFTQSDTVIPVDLGYGVAGSLDELNSRNLRTDASIGTRAAARTLTLTVEVGSPLINKVVGANSFSVTIHDRSYDYSFAIGSEEFSFSTTYEEITRDGIHAAQRTLIEAAALWFLQSVFAANLSDDLVAECYNGLRSASFIASRARAWNNWSRPEKFETIQRLLKRAGHYSGKVDHSETKATLLAASSYLRKTKDFAVPNTYSERDLWHLFIALSKEYGEQ